jgi:hypothetical protein
LRRRAVQSGPGEGRSGARAPEPEPGPGVRPSRKRNPEAVSATGPSPTRIGYADSDALQPRHWTANRLPRRGVTASSGSRTRVFQVPGWVTAKPAAAQRDRVAPTRTVAVRPVGVADSECFKLVLVANLKPEVSQSNHRDPAQRPPSSSWLQTTGRLPEPPSPES